MFKVYKMVSSFEQCLFCLWAKVFVIANGSSMSSWPNLLKGGLIWILPQEKHFWTN